MVKKMPTWKFTDKDVSKAKAEESLKAVKGACFGCDTHNADCPIAGAAGAISEMLGCESLSVREQIHSQISGALKGAKFPIKTPKRSYRSIPEWCGHDLPGRGPEDDCQRGRKTAQGFGLPVQECEGRCRCHC